MTPSYIRVRAVVWAYGRGQTDRHTDARDHNTFCVVYDSRKIVSDIAIFVLKRDVKLQLTN